MPEYLQPVPRSVLFELLQSKLREVRETGGKLPREMCVVSYLFDLQSAEGEEGIKRQCDYARIWGWSQSWVSKNIDDIAAEAREQASFHRKERRKREKEQRKTASTENGDSSDLRGGSERAHQDEKRDSKERIKTNRSHYSDYQSNGRGRGREHSREGSPPDPSPSDSSPPQELPAFDFLNEKDEVHRVAIEYAAEQLGGDLADPVKLAALCDQEWNRFGAIKPYEIKQLLDTESGKYSPEVLVAAIVEAGDDKDPNRGLLNAILQRLHAQQQDVKSGRSPRPAKQQGGNPVPSPGHDRDPASDHEHNLRLAREALNLGPAGMGRAGHA